MVAAAALCERLVAFCLTRSDSEGVEEGGALNEMEEGGGLEESRDLNGVEDLCIPTSWEREGCDSAACDGNLSCEAFCLAASSSASEFEEGLAAPSDVLWPCPVWAEISDDKLSDGGDCSDGDCCDGSDCCDGDCCDVCESYLTRKVRLE